MAEPTAGIIPASSFGEREPPASRGKPKEKARGKAANASTPAEILLATDPDEMDGTEKHELDTLA